MKVCVLYCRDEVAPPGGLAPARAPIELAEYGPRHEYAYHELTKNTAVRELKRLARRDFDVFLNLCDGAWDESRPGIEVVDLVSNIERHHLDETILAEGDPPGDAYVIWDGRVKLLQHHRPPRVIGPGEVIGELAALHGKPRTATAIALDDTVLLTLPRDELLAELSP